MSCICLSLVSLQAFWWIQKYYYSILLLLLLHHHKGHYSYYSLTVMEQFIIMKTSPRGDYPSDHQNSSVKGSARGHPLISSTHVTGLLSDRLLAQAAGQAISFECPNCEIAWWTLFATLENGWFQFTLYHHYVAIFPPNSIHLKTLLSLFTPNGFKRAICAVHRGQWCIL